MDKGLTPATLSLLQFVAVGFFLGNGIEHMSDAVKKKKPVNSDVMRVEDTLRKIQQAQLVLSDQVSVNQQQTAALSQQITQPPPPAPVPATRRTPNITEEDDGY